MPLYFQIYLLSYKIVMKCVVLGDQGFRVRDQNKSVSDPTSPSGQEYQGTEDETLHSALGTQLSAHEVGRFQMYETRQQTPVPPVPGLSAAGRRRGGSSGTVAHLLPLQTVLCLPTGNTQLLHI